MIIRVMTTRVTTTITMIGVHAVITTTACIIMTITVIMGMGTATPRPVSTAPSP